MIIFWVFRARNCQLTLETNTYIPGRISASDLLLELLLYFGCGRALLILGFSASGNGVEHNGAEMI
jgi:hypothetical protein